MTACKEKTDVSLSDDTSVSSLIQKESTSQKSEISQEIVVYVSGAVRHPGVYTLKQGDRVYQAVELAGGMTREAKKDYINLAETVADAQNIHVITKKEFKKIHNKDKGIIGNVHGKTTDTDLVNINVDDEDRLMTLPGIGASKAAAIIAYREENGQFALKEDIQNVSGIGEATYADIEDLITVK